MIAWNRVCSHLEIILEMGLISSKGILSLPGDLLLGDLSMKEDMLYFSSMSTNWSVVLVFDSSGGCIGVVLFCVVPPLDTEAKCFLVCGSCFSERWDEFCFLCRFLMVADIVLVASELFDNCRLLVHL